jgi:hypothetical protein
MAKSQGDDITRVAGRLIPWRIFFVRVRKSPWTEEFRGAEDLQGLSLYKHRRPSSSHDCLRDNAADISHTC